MKERVLLFERHSALLVAGAWRDVRRADRIVFSRRIPLSPVPARDKRWALAIARLLNRRARIDEVQTEQLLDYLPLNARGVGVVDGLAGAVRATAGFARLRNLAGTDDVIRYYQGALSIVAVNWGLFPLVAAGVSHGVELTAVADWDTRLMAAHFGETATFAGGAGARARRVIARMSALARALAVPGALVVRGLRNGVQRGPRRAFKVAMPVIWGIKEPADGRPHADDYLYGGALAPGDIVHIFGDFDTGPANRMRFETAMRARGYAFLHKSRYRIDRATLKASLRVFWAALSLLYPRYRGAVDVLVLTATPKAFYHYLRKVLELGNVHYDVEMVRNDYNPGHVIATAVARREGIRSVGVQHNALPFESPQLAFVDVDDFAIYGEFYRRGYAPHWGRLRLHHTGRESLDWAVAPRQDPARLRDVRRRWRELRPAEKPTVLFLFPSERDITIPRNWSAMFAGLERIIDCTPDVDLVMRFRTETSASAPHISPFFSLPARSPRAIVAPSSFTTYELMAVSDLVITYDGSFTVNEAVAMGLPVFSFEFIGAGHHYFQEYGTHFVLTTADDVVRTVQALASGTLDRLDVDWAALRRDLNSHADGCNRLRLRGLVERAAGLASDAPLARVV